MSIQPLNDLLAKEVNRKEFLLYFGLFLVTVTGVSGIVKNVSSLSQPKATQGFGSKPYGM
jgi:hypothetical protein